MARPVGSKNNPPMVEYQVQALAKADPRDLAEVKDELLNMEALARIRSEPSYHPLSSLIPQKLAAQVEPWLAQYGKFHPKTRVTLYKILLFNLTEGNWAKSKRAMSIELGIDERDLNYFRLKWPQMWLLINLLVRAEAESKVGRVIDSMTDAAIMGDSRDRRLYLEYFGHIKQEQRSEGGVTINFHNDVMNRPPAIDVEIVKEGSED